MYNRNLTYVLLGVFLLLSLITACTDSPPSTAVNETINVPNEINNVQLRVSNGEEEAFLLIQEGGHGTIIFNNKCSIKVEVISTLTSP